MNMHLYNVDPVGFHFGIPVVTLLNQKQFDQCEDDHNCCRYKDPVQPMPGANLTIVQVSFAILKSMIHWYHHHHHERSQNSEVAPHVRPVLWSIDVVTVVATVVTDPMAIHLSLSSHDSFAFCWHGYYDDHPCRLY